MDMDMMNLLEWTPFLIGAICQFALTEGAALLILRVAHKEDWAIPSTGSLAHALAAKVGAKFKEGDSPFAFNPFTNTVHGRAPQGLFELANFAHELGHTQQLRGPWAAFMYGTLAARLASLALAPLAVAWLLGVAWAGPAAVWVGGAVLGWNTALTLGNELDASRRGMRLLREAGLSSAECRSAGRLLMALASSYAISAAHFVTRWAAVKTPAGRGGRLLMYWQVSIFACLALVLLGAGLPTGVVAWAVAWVVVDFIVGVLCFADYTIQQAVGSARARRREKGVAAEALENM